MVPVSLFANFWRLKLISTALDIYKKSGIFWIFSFYVRYSTLLHLPPSDSTVPEDAGIEPRTVATTALAVRRSNHSARSHPLSARSHPHSARSHPHSARSHPLWMRSSRVWIRHTVYRYQIPRYRTYKDSL
jgi:hypothetical protein